MVEQNVIEEFIDAVKQEQTEENNTYSAVVNRIDDEGVIWVRVAGSDSETPISTTSAEIKRGDEVNVEWRNNQLYIAGNTSDPSAGVVRVANIEQDALRARVAAESAVESANKANEAAQQAVVDAATAHQAADDAQDSADAAQTSADNAASAAATAGRAASAAQAAAEAAQGDIDEQKEWFWHDTNGSHVLGAESGYRNDTSSTGMKIVETATEESVAEFGVDGAILGKEDETHAEIDYHSMKLVDRNGNIYFYVSDLRNETGYATITETFISDGSIYVRSTFVPVGGFTEVSINGTATTDYRTSGSNPKLITLNNAPNIGDVIQITYLTDSSHAKAYTFGVRRTGNVGAMSVAEGHSTVASGGYSHAEGFHTEASGECSHAEGDYSEASGEYSHAEGGYTEASGYASHASGYASIANGSLHFVIGEYNEVDTLRTARGYTYGKYVFIIGNGRSSSERSNAFAVTWDGNVELALDTTAAAGTTDGDLYAAITALGWESEVIA